MSEKKGVIAFQVSYMRLTEGDLVAALVLSQLYYWYTPDKKGLSKLTQYRKGQWWVAKTVAEWEAETGLSPKQVRRGLSVLTTLGLITTEVFRFKFTGSPTIHCRFQGLEGREVLNSPARLFHLSGKEIPYAPQGNSLYTEITTETTPEKKQVTEKNSVTGEPMNSLETLKNLQEKQKKKHTRPDLLWKDRMAVIHSSYQELKQLEEIKLKKAAQAIKGKGYDPIDVIDWALQNWIKVGWVAQAAKGLATFPHVPHTGFLLAHFESAIVAYDESLVAGVTKAKLAAPVQLIAKPEEEAKPSDETVAEMLEYFKVKN